LAFHHSGGDTFAIREWLAADADGRDFHDRGLGGEIACDPAGCIGKLAGGGLVAYGLEPGASRRIAGRLPSSSPCTMIRRELSCDGDRPCVVAGAWRIDAPARGFGFCHPIRAVEEFRPAVVSRCDAHSESKSAGCGRQAHR